MLYRACQFTVDRAVSFEVVREVLGEPCPAPMCPEAAYSVDLTFRFLADVVRHNKAVPDDDPVKAALAAWSQQWPLSSVGIADVAPVNLEVILGHKGLRRRYADRVIQIGDSQRASDPRVCRAIEEAIGLHTALAGRLASVLSPRVADEDRTRS
jgi:hypothetical protein